MTDKEKIKAYDEALEKARKLCAYPTSKPFIGDLQDLFPELKESEDVKIRKEIISNFNETIDNIKSEEIIPHESKVLIGKMQKWIAWLEKQGEQKPADKVKPKFKVGNWVVYECGEETSTLQIARIFGKTYVFSDESTLNVVDEDSLRLWSIQDAKDGDVLCTYECGKPKIVFILKGAPKKPYVLGYHCFYNIMYPHFEFDSEKGCLAPNEEDVKPATKEQRDTLMKAMADAGYTFDFEKKELKKIEQKPAGWSEEDEKMINSIIRELIHQYNEEIPQGTEDKINWLKSIKDRVQPQPKPAWSEEDEKTIVKMRDFFIRVLGDKPDFTEDKRYEEFIEFIDNRLKSLRPHSSYHEGFKKGFAKAKEMHYNHWKPSDEQMDALQYVYKNINPPLSDKLGWDSLRTLELMYQDLKKLRVE